MKLISFDIGIKNMAYCIFVVDPSNHTISVQDWNVINLMNSSSCLTNNVETTLCGCILRSKKNTNKICGHKSQFIKSGNYYCKKHAKEYALESSNNRQYAYILPEPSISQTSLKRLSKADLIELCKTWSIPILHDPYTKPLLLNHVIQWFSTRIFETISVKKSKTASETDLITLGRNMKNHLQSIVHIHDATHIIMENQISPLAGRMKTIQGMLAQYFIMQDPSPEIEFISSSNKLKDFIPATGRPVGDICVLENSVVVDDTKTIRQIYQQHKTDAVLFCRQVLHANPFLGSWTLENTNKKDDLADCFLQGIWYLKHAKYIICAENLKINLV